MSTNYYVRPAGTPEGDEGIHLGKWGSAGFTFQAHPDRDVMTYEAWLGLLDLGEIWSESGYTLTRDEMIQHANEQVPAYARTGKLRLADRYPHYFVEQGRLFCTADFS